MVEGLRSGRSPYLDVEVLLALPLGGFSQVTVLAGAEDLQGGVQGDHDCRSSCGRLAQARAPLL